MARFIYFVIYLKFKVNESGSWGRMSNCVVEVGDRDRSVEDADGVVVPGMFSFGEDTVYGARGFKRAHVLAGVVLYRGGARTVREGV